MEFTFFSSIIPLTNCDHKAGGAFRDVNFSFWLGARYRWIDYQDVDEATEREHIARTVKVHEEMLGQRPLGIYQVLRTR